MKIWPLLMALTAFVALFIMESGSLSLPIFAFLILMAWFVPLRIQNRLPLNWVVRLLAYGIVILCNFSRKVDTINMFDTRTMGWFGEFCAAELAVRVWLKPDKDGSPLRLVLLSGLILLAATTSSDDNLLLYISPLYICMLLFTLRGAALPPADQANVARRRFPVRYLLSLLCVLALGGGISMGVRIYRNELTNWGMRMLGERDMRETGALSLSPRLTQTFGQPGSLTRALRIEGEGDFSHLRGVTFDTYKDGVWSPRAQDRRFREALPGEMRPDAPGKRAQVIRLLNNHGLIFAPLDVAGLDFPDTAGLNVSPENHGPLHVDSPAPSEYELILSPEPEHQGPLCTPPSADERQRLLAIPASIEPGVRNLAQRIGNGISDPRRRMDAIEAYLGSHHHYSLSVKMPEGDPVSRFLMERKSAHCEYFASAAVILARLLGIPSRYVIGYYGHEAEGDHIMIVRQRDAHAWAECWIDGTGWTVLDATPGDGRPDGLAEPISPITRFMERLQDSVTKFRAWLAALSPWKLAALGAGIILTGLAAQLLLQLRIRKPRPRSTFAYTLTDAETATLYREFERSCRRRGLTCPPGETWREYLESAEASNRAGSGSTLEAARVFLGLYYPARFGGQVTLQEHERMREALRQIQA